MTTIHATRHPAGLEVRTRWDGAAEGRMLVSVGAWLGAWSLARRAKLDDESARGCALRTLQNLAGHEARGCRWLRKPETATERRARELREDPGSAAMFAAELKRRTR